MSHITTVNVKFERYCMWCSTRLNIGPYFILYVNDIMSTSNVLDLVLFADDTTILYSHRDSNSQVNVVNDELKEVSNWFRANNYQ